MNYKRVERLYCEQQLQVRRRKRKKVPLGERAPLLRPTKANQVWSMDVVFDRTAEGRAIKCLVIVDDATHEAVAIDVERAISGHGVVRVLDRLAHSRGLPKMIRTDNGKEFCGKAMVAWAHANGVQLRQIQPGKPNQNAYVESFNGSATRRMPQRRLVPNAAACAHRDRTLAPRIQRTPPKESNRRNDAGGLCPAVGQ